MADFELDIKVYGATKVANKYRRAARELAPLLDYIVKDWMYAKRQEIKEKAYPPERPGQTYVRTYTLPTGWYVEKLGDAKYRLGNWVEYAHWVVDEVYQAWMHVDRWWTAQEQITPSPDLTKKLTDKIKKLL